MMVLQVGSDYPEKSYSVESGIIDISDAAQQSRGTKLPACAGPLL